MGSLTSPIACRARCSCDEARIARRELNHLQRTFVRATILSVRRCARDRSSKLLQRYSQRPKSSDWKLFLPVLRGQASPATSRPEHLQHQTLGWCPLSLLSGNERARRAPTPLLRARNTNHGCECSLGCATGLRRICHHAVSSSFWI